MSRIRKNVTRALLAVLAVAALSGCDPRSTWPPVVTRHHHKPPPRELVCQHYWPDGHTGCQP